MSGPYHNLDDSAAAALYALAPLDTEYMGALYSAGEELRRSNIVASSSDSGVRGKLSVPRGAMRALFHNHPRAKGTRDVSRAEFSPDDKAQARKLGVPSYITAGGRVRRFDPRTNNTEDVLAQFPMDEFRAYLMRTLLEREPDDPRGLMR